MKKVVILILILIVAKSGAQSSASVQPNLVEKQVAYFIKGSWKPFSGNVMVKDEELGLLTKIKVENGFPTRTEMYKDKHLVQVMVNGVEVDHRNSSSIFDEKTIFTNRDDIKTGYVILSYFQNATTKVKFSGTIEIEDYRIYYSNGIKTKIEYYYDENFKKIMDRYTVFYTELGNIEDEEGNDIYRGPYTKWNEEGTIIEEGNYQE